jgi:hypothetical protein
MTPTNQWIWISRWREFQHYRPRPERGPAWIKDYAAQLDDWRYLELTPTQRALLTDLRRMFSAGRAQLKRSTSAIGARLQMTVYHKDLEALNHAGFIEFISRETLEKRLEELYSNSRAEVDKDLKEPTKGSSGDTPRPVQRTYKTPKPPPRSSVSGAPARLVCPVPTCRLACFRSQAELDDHLCVVHWKES